ncbi:lectin-like protein, partial [Nodularia spumigena CS-584]
VGADQGGNGGNGGNGGFGGGGGGGGGGGADYDRDSTNDNGSGGAGGAGGSFGGKGSDGVGGLAVGNTSSEASNNNRLSGRGGGGAGLGGAIFVNSGASLTLLNSVFTGNSVAGGQGGNIGEGVAPNIFLKNGATAQAIGTNYSDTSGTITDVTFPTNAYQYKGSIYRHTTDETWQQAQLQAQSLGGNLVTVNDEAEQRWLVSTFGSSEPLWTGLTDEVTEGQFKWVSGETSTYTNWYPGEPNNDGNEDYVGMNFRDAGKWNDYPSTTSQRGIIENKFYEYNGSKYLLTGPGTWEQAQAQAQSLGGNLVTINSQVEQDWLVNTFGTEQLWIGLTDKVTQGQFKWASGENSTYTNWYPGEPNGNNGQEDYVGMNFGGAGKWNDYPSTYSQRGIIEINQYAATGSNTDSQFFVLAKPEKFTVSAVGGFGPDIFQLRSYDGLTTSQKVSGSQGSDIFNISIEGSSGTVGLDFNTGKLKQLAELLVEPDWDVREERRAADLTHASMGASIDYIAIAAKSATFFDITDTAENVIDVFAVTAHWANDRANIAKNYNLDIKEYQNNLAGIGNFFDGQGANGWGTVNVTQRRSIVEIMDFQPGIDTITLPKLTDNNSYNYTLASGSINGTSVEVAYNNQTNEPSTFLRIYIDPNLFPTVQGQNVGVTQFIESLFTNNATNGVIGKTRNNTSKVAVSGESYTGTIAGDYIYVTENNPTVGSVKIYGLAGDDLLAGRKNGTNEIYGGEGNDLIVPGGVNDIIDGGTGYDQVYYSQNTVGISITSSNSTNFKNVESVVGTDYNDTINFSDLQVAPEDGLPINLEGSGGNDTLIGSQYNDVINGGEDDDYLDGNEGSDILFGGLGADKFVFNSVLEGIDTIKDFSHLEGDKIVIGSTFGATATSQFNYDDNIGALSFGSNQFATLNTNSGFIITQDLILYNNNLSLNINGSSNEYALSAASQDVTDEFTISADKTQLGLSGNTWKKLDIGNYNITNNTILEFEFQSSKRGEIHGIGFDTDNDVINNPQNLFQLSGTQ